MCIIGVDVYQEKGHVVHQQYVPINHDVTRKLLAAAANLMPVSSSNGSFPIQSLHTPSNAATAASTAPSTNMPAPSLDHPAATSFASSVDPYHRLALSTSFNMMEQSTLNEQVRSTEITTSSHILARSQCHSYLADFFMAYGSNFCI